MEPKARGFRKVPSGRVWGSGERVWTPPPLSSGISAGLGLWNSIDFLRFIVFPRSQEGDPRREPDAREESWDHTRIVRDEFIKYLS